MKITVEQAIEILRENGITAIRSNYPGRNRFVLGISRYLYEKAESVLSSVENDFSYYTF